MTRYFYTDELASAWMAKHFGMRFTSGPPDEYELTRSYPAMWEENDGLNRSEYNRRFYIHPNSLDLLKPQNGDRLLWRGYGRTEWKYEEAHAQTTMKGWEFLILQRNGTPFIWPEREAA
jgi:hypothetical protein